MGKSGRDIAGVEGIDKSWIKLVKGDDDISEFNTPKDANIRVTDILGEFGKE